MNVYWFCFAGDKRLIYRCEQSIVTWAEIRQLAARRLRVEPAAVEVRAIPEAAVVDVRWTGDDYAHGGGPGGRKLQERMTGEEWTDV